MPGESFRRRLRSLLFCMCYVFQALKIIGKNKIKMPGESYRRRLRYLLLCMCYIFRALKIRVNS